MFFSKSLIGTVALCLSLSLEATAHAVISPALGLTAAPIRADAQRPNTRKPCGKADLAAIDTSGTITPNADGTFAATITSFNLGVDGSRQVTASINADGTGQSFVNAQVIQNGDRRVTSKTSQQLVIQMPAGLTCTGGASGTKCLASFKSASGFGNCVVIDTGSTAANGTASTGTASTGTASTGTDATGATGTDATGTDTTGDDTTGDDTTDATDAASTDAAATATDAAAASTATDAAAAASTATDANASKKGKAAAKAAGIKRFFEAQRETRAVGTRAPRMARRRAVLA